MLQSHDYNNEMQIIASDGHHVRNDFSCSVDFSKACLLIHGLTGTRHENGIFDILKDALEKDHYAVLRIDLRGHGDSTIAFEKASFNGMMEDVRAAYYFLNRLYQEVDVIGMSAGGALANILADELQPRKLVLLNPVTSWRKTVQYIAQKRQHGHMVITKKPSTRFILQALAQNPDTASKSGIPTLLLHGREDEIVSIRISRVFATQRPHVVFEELEGLGHVLTNHHTNVVDRTMMWLNT